MKLITGRSGTGKSIYCMNEIKKYVLEAYDRPLIYIVPEQFSFEAEKELIRTIGRKGIINTQVFSFKRLAYKIFTENNVKINPLGNSGKTMLIYFIMLKLEKELLVLKNVSRNTGLIDTVVKQISEFKRYQITPEMLQELKIENEYLKRKIQDLAMIYAEYEKRIQTEYVDANDELTLLAEVLKTDTYLNGAKIWIDEFDGFTPQEFEIIRQLIKKADVTISMIDGQEEFFQLNHKNIEKLRFLVAPKVDRYAINSSNFDTYTKNTQEIEEISLEKTYRFQNEELKHLEKSLYQIPFQKYEKDVKHIFIHSYSNLNQEVEALAQNILRYVRDSQTIRFENIAVLTRDMEQYKNLFKMIFPLYEIPYFFDDKKELSLQPLISFLMAFIDICTSNYSYESIFTYLKTGLSNIQDENDIDMLENYVLKWGIRGKTWESEFTLEDKNLEKLNQIREVIITPILSFKEALKKQKTVKEIVEAVFHFLVEIGVYAQIEEKVEKFKNSNHATYVAIASEYAQVWNILMSILDEMVDAIGEEKCTFERFKAILKMGISNHEIGIIPPTKDKVTIGDIERTRNNAIKVLFILGVNDGAFPKAFQNEGFINDKERGILLEQGMEIAKDTKMLLVEENFNLYKALCVPSEDLYLSYPVSNLEGKAMRPSFLITQMKRMFPQLKEEIQIAGGASQEEKKEIYAPEATFPILLNQVRNYVDTGTLADSWKGVYRWYSENEKEKLESVLKGLQYRNTIEYQSKQATKRLYGETMNTSVSRLEKYVSCPYSFYLKYGLKAKEREVYKVGAPDIGSFLHEIIEKFSKKVLEENIDLRTLEQEACNAIVSQIVDEVVSNFRHNLLQSTGKLRRLSIKLKQLVMKTIWLITLHIKAGEFNIYGSEVEFGKEKEYPAIEIELSDGNHLSLTGKVDRIDVAETEDGKYIRIIDYKSSSKKIKLSDVYYGVQLQLLTYMDALAGDEFLPGGMLYLKLDDPILRTTKNVSKEEIEELIVKSLRMNGLVLANARLVEAMDQNMGTESNILNLKVKKDGSYGNMPTVTSEEFEKLRKHIRKTLADIGNEIMSGNIKNEPLKRKGATTPCEYCEYKLICQFDKDLGNQYHYINELKDEEVLAKIREE